MSPVREALPLSSSGGDLLIVDDFADARALYTELLRDDGHQVRSASSGQEALRLVEEREPELVLLDVSMPGMDGYEVLERLQKRPGGGPSVFMLTAARREPGAIERGLGRGAEAYLIKPIEGRELLARVRGLLEKHRLRRALEAERRDHVAMLVHDLRQPLSSLGLVAEMLEEDGLDPAELRDAVGTMRAQLAEMARLVDGVLAASRLEAGLFTVDRKPTTVREVLDPTSHTFGPIAHRRRIDLRFEGALDAKVAADSPKLRQALENLLANSLKFTPKGGRARVRVERKGGRVDIVVEDSGPGIPPVERGTLFERYRQGAQGRSRGGAGLGLAIAKGITEAHGGTVVCEDSELGGAAFRLSLPG